MSRKLVNAALKVNDPNLDLMDKLVLVTLANLADENGKVTITDKELEKAVRRNALVVLEASLEKDGLI